ncbi:hypothetical protein [uncultured Bacteroides sp.]|uniref:hypothetical protein n=1 Tax=uncultured Bacteroides sp. TaxID=162156 RepID=UPI00267594A9|nr:hypothetical protein [uncultured Bacteroides sp.]
MINNIEGLLNDVLLDYKRISEAVHASISESIKLSDLDKLYEVWRHGDRAEPLYRLLQEKAKKGADAFREYLHGMLYFEDDNELMEALAEGPIKTLIADALSLVQQLEPGMLVTRDNRNGAVVYQVEKGYTCRCILDGARVEIYAPVWSGHCPPNYNRLEQGALISVNGEWWQVAGELRRRTMPGGDEAHFAKAALCLGYLYVNNLITLRERRAIGNRLNRYRDKYNVDITVAQLNSVRLTYNDIATDEKGGDEE